MRSAPPFLKKIHMKKDSYEDRKDSYEGSFFFTFSKILKVLYLLFENIKGLLYLRIKYNMEDERVEE